MSTLPREYSQCLGSISSQQFQAALDRFHLGRFVDAEPIPFGFSKRNVLLKSTTGSYVFRGAPHHPSQFFSEQFFTRQLHEKTPVPVPWPYLIDSTKDIFEWSYAIMPLMPGLQLADLQVQSHLTKKERRGIAYAMGANLAQMQELTWPFAGQYDATTNAIAPFEEAYGNWVISRIRRNLALSREHNNNTTAADAAWIEKLITQSQASFDTPFEPCIVMQDYKENNVVATCTQEHWHISGTFDFTHMHFGDGEADLVRSIAMYFDEDYQLVREFLFGYTKYKRLRPGFAERFPIYMLDDRLTIWEFLQKIGKIEWDAYWTFRDWAERYTSIEAIFAEDCNTINLLSSSSR